MRKWMLFCTVLFLLLGCANRAEPVPPETTEEITEAEITIPETEETTMPTVDPMEELLESMSLPEKVGQLFLARCPGEEGAEDAANYHLGGYILFGVDFENQTPDSVREHIASYQAAAKIPMLIAVDEEGGTVCRASINQNFRFEKFQSPRNLYSQGGLDYVLATETEKAIFLNDLGINVNMGPVCDVTPDMGFMYYRSLGLSPEETGRFAAGTVERYEFFNVGAVLKHFPGYGQNADTHVGLARDRRSLESLENADLIPFAAGIAAGSPAILMSHTIVECFDTELPATLCPSIHSYLRTEMGFEGVIVTDDLSMQAISDYYGAGESAVLAVLAGNDLLCSTDYRIQYEAVLNAVLEGRITEEALNTSVMRILRWKQAIGIL